MKIKSRLLSIVTIFVITLTLLALMLTIFGADTTFADAAQAPVAKVAAKNSAAAAVKQQSGPAVYIVVLQDEPLAAYKGGIQGLAATNPRVRGERKLDVDSPDSVAYLAYLAQKRDEAIVEISNALGRNVTAVYEYKAALNGLAVELTAAEAAVVANLPEVKFLEQEIQYELETDAGPSWIGAPSIWSGTQSNRDFYAEIDESQEVPPTGSAATGTGTFTYNFETMELTWVISHTGLVSITAAHIHSATVGVNGSVEIPLDHTVNPMVGSAILTVDQEWGLVNGLFYVNIHTEDNPSGEIRGQIWQNGNMGEGIIVGVIDTGIDPWNPSFADLGGDSYDHTNPWGVGTYVGVCDPGDSTYDPTFPCNDKLIGAWGFASVNGGDPRDSDGHGSHTASTAAGNFVNDTVITTSSRVFTASISGVAPHANVVMYAACCTGAALAAARDQVVLDEVDVVNYSIGANVPTNNPWSDAESQQWLNMRDVGIFVATSAGNNGPNDATLFRPGDIPWLTAVAASSHNRTFLNSLTISDGVTGSITLNGESMTGPLITPTEVVFSSWYTAGGTIDPEDARLCADGVFSGTVDFNGAIVVCERGIYGRVAKGQTVLDAGAGGYILAQPDEFGGGPGSLAPDPHVLPAVHIDYYEYQRLLDYMANAPGPVNGTIAGSVQDIDDAHGDILASFSSRGPNSAPLLPDILKPQVAAPGRGIWAAYGQGPGGDGDYTFNVIQGTSMASPHVAGAGALLMALYPEWTPSMIESALATTANTDVFNDDGTNPATPFGIGSGRVDLEAAAQAGLVLDVTTAEFQAANPNTGGDPKVLNLSSLANSNCLNSCSWTRTVSSTQSQPVTWTASVTAPAGMTLTVDPPSFVLPAHGTQVLEITADVSGLSIGQWSFAEVALTPSGAAVSEAHFPVAVIQAGDPPVIEIPPDAESAQVMDVSVVKPFTITNNGGTDLIWDIFEDVSTMAPASLSDALVDADVERQVLAAPVEPAAPGSGPAFSGGIVADGGFEAGSPNPSWNEFSSNFGTPLCSQATCGGPAPNTGSWHVWFGGTSNPETGSVDQDVTIPVGEATLSFWLLMGSAGGSGFMSVDIDGTVVFSVTEADVGSYGSQTEVTVDISTFADGGVHNLQLLSSTSGGTLNFFVDDVEIAATGVATCDAPDDISWLSVSPESGTTVSGTSSVVDLTFNSTGLSAGVYTGTLCVSSNDPANPLVSAPVTLTVAAQGPPDIAVDPASLSASHSPDNVSTQTFDISNVGEADLNWTIDEDTETGAGRSAASTVLLDQPPNQSNGSFSDVDCDACATGTQVLADNFVLANSAVITQITFWSGYFPNNMALVKDDLTVIFHADSSGSPGVALSTETSVPYTRTTTGIVLFGVNEYEHTITLSNPVALDAGTYWVEIYNDTTGNTDSFFWEVGDLDAINGIANAVFAQQAPGTTWTTTPNDFAVRIEGFETGVCVDLADIPWASVSPTAGTTVSNTSSTVDVTFDSTGLTFGVYTGTLCINSNDPDMPVVQLPLTLTVDAPAYGVDIAPDATMSGTAGTTVTYTLQVMNTGNTPDVFDLAVSGNSWTTTLSDSSVSLGIGESAAVMVTVDIPAGTANGQMDTVMVTATSQGDPGVSASATLVTTAVFSGPPTVYLPVFIKN